MPTEFGDTVRVTKPAVADPISPGSVLPSLPPAGKASGAWCLSLPGLSERTASRENRVERLRVVERQFLRCEEQRDASTACQPPDLRDGVRYTRKFGGVASLEFLPLDRIVIKPPAQCVGWGDFLQPDVDPRRLRRHSPGPEPIDQDPDTIVVTGGFVDALQAKAHAYPPLGNTAGSITSPTRPRP